MPKCKTCGNKGLFLKLNSAGNCLECEKKGRKAEADRHFLAMETMSDFWIADERRKNIEIVKNISEAKIELGDDDIPREAWVPYTDPVIIKPSDVKPEVVSINVDTTGINPTLDSIFEVSAIKFRDGQPVLKFHSFVNPEVPVSEDVYHIKKITDEMLQGQPTIAQLIPSLDDFVGKCDLAGHNIDFVMKFLLHSGSRLYHPGTDQKIFDTYRTAKSLWDGTIDDFRLPSICKFYGLTIPNAHTGVYVAYATGQLFYAMLKTMESE